MTKSKAKIILLALIFSIFGPITFGTVTYAQYASDATSYTLIEPLPCLDDDCESGEVITKISFKAYAQYVFNLLIALSAVAAVFMIVLGGFQYMTTDSWQGKSAGVEKIRHAVMGLVLVLTSFLILRTIDPRLVEIHPSLVAPLDIKYDRDKLAGFFSQLEKEAADADRLSNKNNRDAVLQADTVVQNLTKAKDELFKELVEAKQQGDTEKVSRLEVQIAEINDQIQSQTGTVQMLVTTAKMEVLTQKYTVSFGTKTRVQSAETLINDLDTLYRSERNKLVALNAQPDQLKSLDNHLYYNRGVIRINEAVAKVYDVQNAYNEQEVYTNRSYDRAMNSAKEAFTKKLFEIDTVFSPMIHDRDLKAKLIQKMTDANRMVVSIKNPHP